MRHDTRNNGLGAVLAPRRTARAMGQWLWISAHNLTMQAPQRIPTLRSQFADFLRFSAERDKLAYGHTNACKGLGAIQSIPGADHRSKESKK
ncbi:hypothetical protein Vi05172_g7773 [Venturia inaequalis]|nr:hypothetical protein Vi05172_g7773 [Venturia inaequalis]